MHTTDLRRIEKYICMHTYTHIPTFVVFIYSSCSANLTFLSHTAILIISMTTRHMKLLIKAINDRFEVDTSFRERYQSPTFKCYSINTLAEDTNPVSDGTF